MSEPEPYTVTLYSRAYRDRAKEAIERAPHGYRVVFLEPRRSLQQNDKLWPMLREISKQLEWHGQRYSEDDWKDIITAGFEKEARYAPTIDGKGFVQLGGRTSKYGKKKMTEFIEYVLWFGAEQGVVFNDPEESAA